MVATTVWPCLARWSAVAKPMPVLVPVTSVTGMGAMLPRGAIKRGDLAAVTQVSNWHRPEIRAAAATESDIGGEPDAPEQHLGGGGDSRF
jgi:hypothetical protein